MLRPYGVGGQIVLAWIDIPIVGDVMMAITLFKSLQQIWAIWNGWLRFSDYVLQPG
jgi:hypothetical protein